MVVRRRRHDSNGSTGDAILGGRGINRTRWWQKRLEKNSKPEKKPEIYKRKEGKKREIKLGEREGRREEETRFFPPSS